MSETPTEPTEPQPTEPQPEPTEPTEPQEGEKDNTAPVHERAGTPSSVTDLPEGAEVDPLTDATPQIIHEQVNSSEQ